MKETNMEFSQKVLKLINEGKVEEAIAELNKRIPKIIYKFFRLECGYDNLIDHLKNGEIFFNVARNMTDKNEFRNVRFEKGNEIDCEIANNMSKQQLRNICFACFTFDQNCIKDEYMWNEYANNAKGILCEFEVIDSSYLFPVLYSNNDVVIRKNYNIYDEEYFNTNKFLFDVLKLILKKENFACENEVRIIFDRGFEGLYNSNGGYINIGKILRLKSIYFGSNCSLQNKEKITKQWNDVNIVHQIQLQKNL